MSLRKLLSIAAWTLAATVFSQATVWAITIHVGPGDLLETALTSASSGDTVLVDCGSYAEQGLRLPAGVTLRSVGGDPTCVAIATVGGAPILTIEDMAPGIRVEGITFTAAVGGLTAPVARGAGLFIANAQPQITNCVFQNLEAGYGAAVYCADGAAPVILGCSFTNNLAHAVGGAVNSVGTAAPTLAVCLFSGNVAESGGDVLNAARGSQPHLVGCTLADNFGTALMSWDAGAISLANCILIGNAWTGDNSATPLLSCSDLFNGSALVWAGLLADQANQNGNISVDPLFCHGAGSNPYALDANSPCTESATNGCGRMGAFGVGCNMSGVDNDGHQNLPPVTRLRGNYPNPFNPSTTIRYDLQKPGPVEIAIFDLAGRRIKQLLHTRLAAGAHEILWRGADDRGRPVPAGVYFVHMRTDDSRDTSRLSVIK